MTIRIKLLGPRLLGVAVIGTSFVAGLAYSNPWPAGITLTFSIIVIWQIVGIGRNVGAIEVYDEVRR